MKKQKLKQPTYSFITVLITVCAFVLYSVYVVEGETLMQVTGTSGVLAAVKSLGGIYMFGTIMPIWAVLLIEFVCAFTLSITIGCPNAFKITAKRFNPQKDNPELFEAALISATVGIMVPAMSFLAAIFYYPYNEGFNILAFLAKYFKLICYNFPFAFFSQLFFIQPVVRKIIGKLFPENK